MLVAGIDIGSKRPACAIVRRGPGRPTLVALWAPVIDDKLSQTARFDAIRPGLVAFLAAHGDVVRVAIEDPASALHGRAVAGGMSAHATVAMLTLRGQAQAICGELGLPYALLRPQSIAARLGIKIPKGLTAYRRRKIKKAMTVSAVGVLVVGAKDLGEDAADAVAAALVVNNSDFKL